MCGGETVRTHRRDGGHTGGEELQALVNCDSTTVLKRLTFLLGPFFVLKFQLKLAYLRNLHYGLSLGVTSSPRVGFTKPS